MSIDPVGLVNLLTTLFLDGVFLFGAYRAFTIGRALVSRVFRNRAYWTGALMILAMIASAGGFLPSSNNVIYDFVEIIPFILVLVVIFSFADSTINAAAALDFFHRDTLRWSKLRIPDYVILFLCVLLAIPGLVIFPSSFFWGLLTLGSFIVIFGFVIGSSIVCLIVSARRIYDQTMKKFVKLLGVALAFLIVGFIIGFTTSNTLPFVTVSDILTNVIAPFFLYRAVMSLSPISKKEKELSQ